MVGTQWCRGVAQEAGSWLWGWCEWLGAMSVVMPYGSPAYTDSSLPSFHQTSLRGLGFLKI